MFSTPVSSIVIFSCSCFFQALSKAFVNTDSGRFKNRTIYNPEITPNLEVTKEEYKKYAAPTINQFYLEWKGEA